MSTFAEQLRSQATELRRQAEELETIAAQMEASASVEIPFARNTDPRSAEVIEAVAAACHVDLAAFWSRRRSDEIAVARHIAAHALHTLLGMRSQPIADALRWRDHASTTHALRKVRERRTVDRVFSEKLNRAMAAAHAVVAQQEGISA